jgi:hypothetical protein
MRQRLVKRIMGKELSISATYGANTVVIRAKKLQIPRAVAEKRTGKSEALARYIVLKATETPKTDSKIIDGKIQGAPILGSGPKKPVACS